MKKENIILLHGALGSKHQFESLKELLSGDFDVLDMNFEGHGDRSSDNEFSIDLFVKNVVDFLTEKEIARTHIFGYSMGGYVGLKLALMNPIIVNKIITLGTKFNWTKEAAAQEIKMLNPDKIEEKVPAFAKRLDQLHTGNNWKALMLKTAKMMVDLGNGKRMTNEELRSIEQDVLIGLGESDRMVTQEESEDAANLIPKSEFRVIERFPHPIEKVDMQELAEVVKSFIHKK